MSNDPAWWSSKHDSTWDRVKAALKRDWEQTKNDFSKHGKDLDQGAGDTVKQAVGKEPIPPADQPNPSRWEDHEPAYRYGVGAREQYAKDHPSWDGKLEQRLSDDWTSLKNGRTWEEVKTSVRQAWDHKVI